MRTIITLTVDTINVGAYSGSDYLVRLCKTGHHGVTVGCLLFSVVQKVLSIVVIAENRSRVHLFFLCEKICCLV